VTGSLGQGSNTGRHGFANILSTEAVNAEKQVAATGNHKAEQLLAHKMGHLTSQPRMHSPAFVCSTGSVPSIKHPAYRAHVEMKPSPSLTARWWINPSLMPIE
jgi:hypothetical protein